MEKAKKDVGQKFRRIKHNLRNSSKKDEDDVLRKVSSLEQRNSRVIGLIGSYKKNVASTIKTGLREENVDKRRRKLDEYSLCTDLKEAAGELDAVNSTCLHKVALKMSQTLQGILEEKVKLDMMVEKRVLDDLTQYQEADKNLLKCREKLTNAITDVEIAKHALDRSDGINSSLQDSFDATQQKLENQKDNTVTEIYTFVAKEQEIAKVFTSLLEEQLEFHRVAMRTIEMALPEIRRDIDNARPRPVFGVDLSEHLRHSQSRIAVVLEKCCDLLRENGFNEKGVFRVSGNNTKIRRMKAAFDAGQIDIDERAYHLDPHSVCSVLKCYLRELPDPLLTNRLHSDWLTAAKLDGEDRLRAIESCILQLPSAHRDNLTYLIKFLYELLEHQDVTAMNASNLAIVFGPNLLGGDIEGNNAAGTRIVETLLKNASRLFGCPINDGSFSSSDMVSSTRSLNIDTSVKRIGSNNSINWRNSPRPRPKEKAPPPPGHRVNDTLIDLNGDWASHQAMSSPSQQFVDRAHEYTAGRGTSGMANNEDSFTDSDESWDDPPDDAMSRSVTGPPGRPPPPSYRTSWESGHSQKNRPVSYNLAVEHRQQPQPSPRSSNAIVIENPLAKSSTIKRPVIVPDVLVGFSDDTNRTVVSIDETPAPSRTKPPLPAKPKPDNESSRL